jgi:hypothetical protein
MFSSCPAASRPRGGGSGWPMHLHTERTHKAAHVQSRLTGALQATRSSAALVVYVQPGICCAHAKALCAAHMQLANPSPFSNFQPTLLCAVSPLHDPAPSELLPAESAEAAHTRTHLLHAHSASGRSAQSIPRQHTWYAPGQKSHSTKGEKEE